MKKLLLFTIAFAALIQAKAQTAPTPVPQNVMEYHRKYMQATMDTADACDPEMEASSAYYNVKGSDKKVALINCFGGAYNISATAYLVESNAHATTIRPIMVLTHDSSVRGVVPTTDLTNADFDENTNTLSTFAKGRGIGDCGQSSKTKLIVDKEYGSVTAKTTEIRSKDKCDGRMTNWPVVFRQ